MNFLVHWHVSPVIFKVALSCSLSTSLCESPSKLLLSFLHCFAGLKDDKFNIWAVVCAKSTAEALFTVYFIMETEEGHRGTSERERDNFPCLLFSVKNPFFLPLHTQTHTHNTHHCKDKMFSNQSSKYPLCCKRGRNDWCTYELKFNWRTHFPVIAAIHQLNPETPLPEENWGNTQLSFFLTQLSATWCDTTGCFWFKT